MANGCSTCLPLGVSDEAAAIRPSERLEEGTLNILPFTRGQDHEAGARTTQERNRGLLSCSHLLALFPGVGARVL